MTREELGAALALIRVELVSAHLVPHLFDGTTRASSLADLKRRVFSALDADVEMTLAAAPDWSSLEEAQCERRRLLLRCVTMLIAERGTGVQEGHLRAAIRAECAEGCTEDQRTAHNAALRACLAWYPSGVDGVRVAWPTFVDAHLAADAAEFVRGIASKPDAPLSESHLSPPNTLHDHD